MDIDNDDDFYDPEPAAAPGTAESTQDAPTTAPATAQESTPAEQKQEADGDLEEGEEEDEGGAMDEDDSSDSDGVSFAPCLFVCLYAASLLTICQSMVIITERKDGTSAAPPS